jgi:hypothetical protein
MVCDMTTTGACQCDHSRHKRLVHPLLHAAVATALLSCGVRHEAPSASPVAPATAVVPAAPISSAATSASSAGAVVGPRISCGDSVCEAPTPVCLIQPMVPGHPHHCSDRCPELSDPAGPFICWLCSRPSDCPSNLTCQGWTLGTRCRAPIDDETLFVLCEVDADCADYCASKAEGKARCNLPRPNADGVQCECSPARSGKPPTATIPNGSMAHTNALFDRGQNFQNRVLCEKGGGRHRATALSGIRSRPAPPGL